MVLLSEDWARAQLVLTWVGDSRKRLSSSSSNGVPPPSQPGEAHNPDEPAKPKPSDAQGNLSWRSSLSMSCDRFLVSLHLNWLQIFATSSTPNRAFFCHTLFLNIRILGYVRFCIDKLRLNGFSCSLFILALCLVFKPSSIDIPCFIEILFFWLPLNFLITAFFLLRRNPKLAFCKNVSLQNWLFGSLGETDRLIEGVGWGVGGMLNTFCGVFALFLCLQEEPLVMFPCHKLCD